MSNYGASNKNAEAHRLYMAQWRRKHPERAAALDKANRESHREQRAIYGQQWRRENEESLRLEKKAYREAHRQEIAAYFRQYRKINRDKLRLYMRAWKATNPDKVAAARSQRQQNLMKVINMNFIWERDKGKCGICGRRVLLKNASPDHIIPISHGGPSVEWNIQITHRECNVRRGPGRIPAQIRLPLT